MSAWPPSSSRRAIALLSLVLVVVGAACSAILGLDAPQEPLTPDAGGFLVPPSSEGGEIFDAGPLLCVPLDAGPDATAYSNIQSTSANPVWDSFDLTNVSTNANNYASGAFDGHFVYYAPSESGVVARYDTRGKFTGSGGWLTFDTETIAAGPTQKFVGAVYDGHYVYFVPRTNVIARLDPGVMFQTQAAWTTFDLSKIQSDAGALSGFSGAAFDGRYIYFVPNNNGAADGIVLRYDTLTATSASLSDLTRYTVYNIAIPNVSAGASGFSGATFDGRYVYLAPYINDAAENSGYSGFVARYDTDASFTTSAAWNVFDTATLTTMRANFGFQGATYDTRYVYFAPDRTGVVARVDTHASFTTRASWSEFDLGALMKLPAGSAPLFIGAAFDGRFVYFVPDIVIPDGGASTTIARYDTLSPYAESCAWSTFNVGLLNGTAGRFFGAIYDGQYLYLTPQGSLTARFNTKTPPAFPDVPGAGSSAF